MKNKILAISVLLLMGCVSMSITPKDDGCKLKGWGSGEGTIEGKCTVKKSIFTWPNFSARINP